MYRKVEDFIADWEEEAKKTLIIFKAVQNETMFKKVNDNVRELGRLAWHITQTLTEMPARAKILAEDILENKPVPDSFDALSNIYETHSKELTTLLRESWNDPDLFEDIEMYGQQWQRTQVLSSLLKHQIHHRAQMTVIMRLLDLKVPGIYGPAKEEWVKYGMATRE